MMRLRILGAPGSGKNGLIGQLLKRYEIPNILPHEIPFPGELHSHADDLDVACGSQAPPLYDPIKMNLFNKNTQNGFILSTTPDNLSQAILIDDFLQQQGKSLNSIIYLDIDFTLLKIRLENSLICDTCSNIDNTADQFSPCNKEPCQGKMLPINDEGLAQAHQRLDKFRYKIEPFLDYYDSIRLLRRINGVGHFYDISNALFAELDRP